jgi:hypothetical protein
MDPPQRIAGMAAMPGWHPHRSGNAKSFLFLTEIQLI